MENEVAQSYPTLCDPWTITYQAPHSMGFSRQNDWSGLPFSSPGDLPDPGVEPGAPVLQADTLMSEPKVYFVEGSYLNLCSRKTEALSIGWNSGKMIDNSLFWC